MKEKFIRIATWLGIMLALTIVALLLWKIFFHADQSTASLKWLQFLQTAGTFLLPPVLCALIWDPNRRPFAWLKMDRTVPWWYYMAGILIMVAAFAAAALTERFLQADNFGVLLINIALMALLPAMAEELSFRGTLQQILGNKHIAIWVTAIIFSAIHMQFYGFIPRMLIGALLGYMFVWTGSLWIPVLMHFTNNGLAVLAFYLFDERAVDNKNIADSIGAGDTWWLGLISLVITCLGLLIFYRRTHKQ